VTTVEELERRLDVVEKGHAVLEAELRVELRHMGEQLDRIEGAVEKRPGGNGGAMLGGAGAGGLGGLVAALAERFLSGH